MKRNLKRAAVLLLTLISVLCFAGLAWSAFRKHDIDVLCNAFRNIEPDGEKGEVRFAVFGDVRCNAGVLENIIDEAERDGGYSFIICTGDMVRNPARPDYMFFCEETLEMWRKTPLLFLPGNHDVEGDSTHPAELYEEYFGERYYSFSVGKVLFVALDNSTDYMDAAQFDWLKNLLATERSGYDALVVFMHEPPIDLRGGGAWHAMNKKQGAELLDMLKEYRATAIFCSHIHSYYEWDWNGIPIYVSGGGGASQDKDRVPMYHFMGVSIKGENLETAVYEVLPEKGVHDRAEFLVESAAYPWYLPVGTVSLVCLISLLLLGRRDLNKKGQINL